MTAEEIKQQYAAWSTEQLTREHDSLREIVGVLKAKRPQDTEIIDRYVRRRSNVSYVLTSRASEQDRAMTGWEIISYNATEEAVRNITADAQQKGYEVRPMPSVTRLGRFDVYARKR